MKTYTIKPLVWEHDQAGGWWSARTSFGNLYAWYRGNTWQIHFSFDYISGGHETLEAAQAAAESWYRERIEQALEVVK